MRVLKPPSVGLRINPEYSEIKPLYDPVAPTPDWNDLRAMQGPVTDRVEGLHFHTMCEQSGYAGAHTGGGEEKFDP